MAAGSRGRGRPFGDASTASLIETFGTDEPDKVSGKGSVAGSHLHEHQAIHVAPMTPRRYIDFDELHQPDQSEVPTLDKLTISPRDFLFDSGAPERARLDMQRFQKIGGTLAVRYVARCIDCPTAQKAVFHWGGIQKLGCRCCVCRECQD